jgi:hypothetical protein
MLSADPTSGQNTARKGGANNSISSTSRSTNSEANVEYEFSKEFLKKQETIQEARLKLA